MCTKSEIYKQKIDGTEVKINSSKFYQNVLSHSNKHITSAA